MGWGGLSGLCNRLLLGGAQEVCEHGAGWAVTVM